MYPAKILVIGDTPPSEGGFFGCIVVRHLKDLPKALADPTSLVFLLLDPRPTLQETPSSDLLEGSINSEALNKMDSRICVLVKTQQLPADSPQVALVLQYLQTLVGPFHLSIMITISKEDEGRTSESSHASDVHLFSLPQPVPLQAIDPTFTSLHLPPELDKALGTLLNLSTDTRYLLKATPDNLPSFLKIVSILSQMGKRFLFWGDDDFLRELHQFLSPSHDSNSIQSNKNPLAPWSKKGSQGVIIVERPIEGWEMEKEMVKWIDPPSTQVEPFYTNLQQALQEGKTACIPALPKDSPLFRLTTLVEQMGRQVQFILFWGTQWNESKVSRLLNLSSYHLIGPVGRGKGLIMGLPIDPSTSPFPLILAQEEVGFSLPELYRKLSPPLRVRPSWDDYFLGIARAVAERATCDRGRSGCVIVRDKAILVTGYVGSPTGLPHCDEVGHQMKKMVHEDGHITQHCVRTVHAEQNAICQAAKYGISLNGGTLYCKMTPCRTCAMLIINCGIHRVVCEYRYHAGGESEELFRLAGIALEFKHSEILPYADQ